MIVITGSVSAAIRLNRTFFWYCLTLPAETHGSFDLRGIRGGGNGDAVSLDFGGKSYMGLVNCKHAEREAPAYQISLPLDLRREVAKAFISSYVLATQTKDGKIPPELREELVLTTDPSRQTIVLTPGKRAPRSCFDECFLNLLERNVFSLDPPPRRSGAGKRDLLVKSVGWMKPEKLHAHKDQTNVIYTLRNDQTGVQYIGKADVLGGRLTTDREGRYIGHPGEDLAEGGFTSWRYDVVNADDSRYLVQVETLLIDHAYHCGVKLSNKQFSKHRKNAINKA